MAGSTVDTPAAAAPAAAEESPITFDEAVARFVEYLTSYRSYSSATIGAYRRDLHLLREFLSGVMATCPPPETSPASG